MCGFSGWFDPDPCERKILEKMNGALAHRGPDGEGIFCEGKIALGHRRLAILDLAGSSQPMISQDGRFVLVYNGELYNFKELRKELKRPFVTAGDTEVLMQALIEWGVKALPKLRGMFSFAFWDRKEETLLLARDPLGVKPLYISQEGERIIFASEIKALLEHPAVSKEIDPVGIGLYLECQYIPAPYSIFRKIKKLPAAHYLVVKRGRFEQNQYWHPSYLPKLEVGEEEAVELLREELRKSVSSMMVSDVPIGAFVSGGIDSSLVAAIMQSESPRPIQIFNLGFGDNLPSEHDFASRVASHIGAEYCPLFVKEQDVIGMIDHLSKTFDEPLGDQAALPTLLLSQLTSRSVKVVLTGEGADEVFAGYSNYPKRLKEAPLTSALHASPFRWLYPLLPKVARKNRIFKAAARPLQRRYTTIPCLFDSELHHSYFTLRNQISLEHLAEGHYLSCDSTEPLDKMLHVDIKLWLADDLLTKVDRSTMAFSLEARVPYLDHRLIEFASRLPACLKLRGTEGKYLLKKAAEKYLPPEIIWRSKAGFVMPLREWLGDKLHPLMKDTLSTLLKRNLFKKGVVEKLIRDETARKRSHATRLWSLIALELWFRRYVPEHCF